MEQSKIQSRALETKLANDPTFYACYPHPRYPTLSITGSICALKCKHCSGRYLEQMLPCHTPDILIETCIKLASNGARGVLLSGGYNEEGHVPFGPFLDAIEQVKKETKLFISAHTGLVPDWLARELGRAGVDLADFDLIADDDTISLVLGVDRTVEDYRRAMKVLKQSLPHLVPHICVGLHAGELRGELKALEIASEVNPSMIVLLVFTPTPRTAFEKISPPSQEDFCEVVTKARLRFPKLQLALGCMRPRGHRRVEFELTALHSGVDRIEMPTHQTLEAATGLGLNIMKLETCCSVPLEFVGE